MAQGWNEILEAHQRWSVGNKRSQLVVAAMENILPTLIEAIDINQMTPFTSMYSLCFSMRDSDRLIAIDVEVPDFNSFCIGLYKSTRSRSLMQQFDGLTADQVLPTIYALAGM